MAPATKTKKKWGVFSEGTLIPISMVATILVPLFCTGVWGIWTLRGAVEKYDTSLTNLTQKVANTDKNVESVEKKLDNFIKLNNDKSWTYAMMRIYADQSKSLNPTVLIPDYRLIKEENTEKSN